MVSCSRCAGVGDCELCGGSDHPDPEMERAYGQLVGEFRYPSTIEMLFWVRGWEAARASVERKAHEQATRIAALEGERGAFLEMITDLVNQACIHREGGDNVVCHSFLSTYEEAFDLLEREGRLKYCEASEVWAQLIWPQEVRE
jgi:hypothetical protein